MALKKEVKTGIVVVAALSMLLYGFNYLKGINIFSHSKTIYGVYTDVAGLVPSNPVVVNGYHVGQVKDIEMEPNASGKIIVTMQISDPRVKIPDNSIAKIISADFLGSKAVQIILGNGSTYIKGGDTLTSQVETSLKEQVNEQVLPLKRKAEELIGSIDSTLGIVQGIFTKNIRNDLSESIVSIRNSLKHFESTSENIDDLMKSEKDRITAILDNVEKISGNLAKNNKQISAAIANLSNITDTLAKANLKGTINNADSALYYTSKIMRKINEGKGSLGMLAKDTALYNRLTSASDNLSKLLQDMKAHPARYVHFSIFGRKD